MADPLAARRDEQEALVALARTYVERLAARLSLKAAVVVGSVARGDFNVWSDVDVVVVSRDLPPREPDRAAVLAADAPGRVKAVGFTPDELVAACRAGNPLAREAVEQGRVLAGEDELRSLAEAAATLGG